MRIPSIEERVIYRGTNSQGRRQGTRVLVPPFLEVYSSSPYFRLREAKGISKRNEKGWNIYNPRRERCYIYIYRIVVWNGRIIKRRDDSKVFSFRRGSDRVYILRRSRIRDGRANSRDSSHRASCSTELLV